MPSSESGDMFGTWKVPNGEASASPPPSRCRSGWPGEAWQDAHPAASNTTRPRAASPGLPSSAACSSEKAGCGADSTHPITEPPRGTARAPSRKNRRTRRAREVIRLPLKVHCGQIVGALVAQRSRLLSRNTERAGIVPANTEARNFSQAGCARPGRAAQRHSERDLRPSR
jgi:hypothetical protein